MRNRLIAQEGEGVRNRETEKQRKGLGRCEKQRNREMGSEDMRNRETEKRI